MAFLIDIEGSDGSGKKTQSLKLVEKLTSMGKDCFRQEFPNYASDSSKPVCMYLNGELGENVNAMSPYQISSLYAVDRLCTMKQLESRLKKDTILVLDRYSPSNMMYQATKIEDKKKRKECIDWLVKFEYGDLALPCPDLIIFLDMPAEKNLELRELRQEKEKGRKQDIIEKDKEYLLQTYNRGKEVCNMLGWKVINCIDKNGNIKDIETIHNDIMKLVLPYIK